jgi:hypothetical protein
MTENPRLLLVVRWVCPFVVAGVSLLCGLLWQPDRYRAVVSPSLEPAEARIENEQNKAVADALNSGRIAYHPAMEKLAQPKSFAWLFGIDLVRTLMLSVIPIVAIGLLIRKTIKKGGKGSPTDDCLDPPREGKMG